MLGKGRCRDGGREGRRTKEARALGELASADPMNGREQNRMHISFKLRRSVAVTFRSIVPLSGSGQASPLGRLGHRDLPDRVRDTIVSREYLRPSFDESFRQQ